MGAGVNVRVAHELGAGNKKGTEETIHTSLLLCAITGLLVCAICLLFSGRMLSMMNTKPELIDQAIFIYEDLFPGNACNGRIQFRKRRIKCHRRYETTIDLPFHCRCGQCSSESVFCYCLSTGAAGVATASAISLYISASLVMIHLLRRTDDLQSISA